MADGFRCTRGHTWTAPDGPDAGACPECGCTTVVAVGSGSGVTQGVAVAAQQHIAAALGDASDHSPTLALPLAPASDLFSSLVVLAEPNGTLPAPSSIVPFGPLGSRDISEFAPPLVPGYEILDEVGRGGMGVVYKARHLSLNRVVALKMILSGAHAGAVERERFRREAEAVAALQNPHIVQIFDIGEANGHPYLALEFVDGGSLAQQLLSGPWRPTRAAELTEVLARTIQFAHDAGIVHRDLKPGNILLGKDEGRRMKDEMKAGGPSDSSFILHPSSFRPKVTDFGLAKRLDETLDGNGGGTRTGAVMGTPSYIAPEQASGKTRDIGPPADVYALGAILYELLTGRPPFRGETPLDTVLQVLHDDPVPPKRLSPLVPRDLETICLKCLSKSPGKRYADATALADDLRRFLQGEPIVARPLSSWGRGVKWARRHPAVAVLLGMTATALLAVVAILSVSYARVRDAVTDREAEARIAANERDRAELLRKQAELLAADNEARRIEADQRAEELKREADRTRRAAYALQLSQVAILCERDPLRAAALLENEQRCPKDLRDFTWHYLRRLCQREDRAYTDHDATDPLRAVAYAPSAMFVATAGDAGQIRVWDPRTGRTWLVLSGHTGAVHGLAFSPDGTVIASAGADGTVKLWELPVKVLDTARDAAKLLPWAVPFVDKIVAVPALEPAFTFDAHAGGAACVAFSPDGRALVTGGRDGYLRWWATTARYPAPPEVAALGGLGAVGAGVDRAAKSADARSVWMTREVHAHNDGVLAVALAQNGKLVASGGADKAAKVWSGDGARPVRTLSGQADAVRAVAVSPDGQTVAVVQNGKPPTIRLYNATTWRDRRLFGHTGFIFALAFSDDGQVLASAGFDKTVRLWDPDEGRERGQLSGHAQQVSALAFAPDRRTLVSAAMDAHAVVWQTSTRTHEPEDLLRSVRETPFRAPAQSVAAVGVGGSGGAFVVADDTGWIRILAADYVRPGGAAPAVAPPLALAALPYGPTQFPREVARAAAGSADGRTFVVAIAGGFLVWQPFPFMGKFDGPPGRPDGRPPRGAFTRPTFVRTPAPVHAVAIDPTGRWIATADPAGVRAYDVRAIPHSPDHFLELHGGALVLAAEGVRELAFHPSREWLAVAAESGARVVTLNGKVLASAAPAPAMGGAPVPVESVAFDKTGDRLATGDASGLIKLWSVDADGRLAFVRDLPGHTGAVYAMCFSPDGRTLASGGDDRAVILWDPIAGQERLALSGHADRVLDVSFALGGSALVTVSRDGAVKRWRADVRVGGDASPRPSPALPRT